MLARAVLRGNAAVVWAVRVTWRVRVSPSQGFQKMFRKQLHLFVQRRIANELRAVDGRESDTALGTVLYDLKVRLSWRASGAGPCVRRVAHADGECVAATQR